MSVSRVSPHGQAHRDDVFGERRASLLNSQTRPGTLWPVAPMQAPHICSQYAILSLFLGKMRNILRQPAPRIQEDKPSGLDAHFEYIDAHMVKKNGLRRPSGGPHLAYGWCAARTTSQTPILRPAAHLTLARRGVSCFYYRAILHST